MKKREIKRKFLEDLENRLPKVEGFETEKKQSNIFVDRKVLLTVACVAAISFTGLCVAVPVMLATSQGNNALSYAIAPMVSLDETLLPDSSVRFPLTIKELPKSKPFKSGVTLSDISVSDKIAYHGEYHGFDVYSTIGEMGWGLEVTAFGNFVFYSPNPHKIYCHKAEDSYSIILTNTGAIEYRSCEMSPIQEFYCDGTFSDEEMLGIYLERIDYYGEMSGVPFVKTDEGYVIGEKSFVATINYYQGFPFEGATLSYRELDFELPKALKENLSREKNRLGLSLYPGISSIQVETQVIRQTLDEPGEDCLFLGELQGYSFYAPRRRIGANLDSPFTYYGLRRALFSKISGCTQIYGYKDGISFSLSYLYQTGEISKDCLWDIGSALFCFSAKDIPEEERNEYATDYYREWQNHYRAGGNGFIL